MTTGTPIVHTAQARESQAVFRALLDAMARPGTLVDLPSLEDPGKHPGYAILRALADHEVTIAAPGDAHLLRQLSLGTGAREADFACAEYVLFTSDPGERLLDLHRGHPEIPEAGATAVIATERVGSGDLSLFCAGPGVRTENAVQVSGLSEATFRARSQACAAYPLGIDLVLVDAAGRCTAIPRTTTVRILRS